MSVFLIVEADDLRPCAEPSKYASPIPRRSLRASPRGRLGKLLLKLFRTTVRFVALALPFVDAGFKLSDAGAEGFDVFFVVRDYFITVSGVLLKLGTVHGQIVKPNVRIIYH